MYSFEISSGYKIHISSLTMLFALFVTACGPSKRITSADQVMDDGESNVVVVSYDLTLDSQRKYPPVNATELHFLCPEADGINPVCFSIDLRYIGYSKKSNYSAYEFRSAGSQAMTMNYGQYTIDSVNNSILVDRIEDVVCHRRPASRATDGGNRRGRRVCKREFDDIKAYHIAELPVPLVFTVDSGAGCYLGHVSLQMYKSSIVDYEFQPGVAITDETLLQLPAQIRGAIAEDVKNPCQ